MYRHRREKPDCALGECLHPPAQLRNMDGLDTSTLHVPGRLHVEILEQCGTCIGRDIIVIDRDADAIAPCLPPENSGHGSVNIEFWINMRSEESRVGEECVSTCVSRGVP